MAELAAAATGPHDTTEPAGTGARRFSILLVDDRPENLLAFRTVLDDLGQELISVTSGKEALREVLKHDFALILLDINMPEMDGFDTAALIRRRRRSEYTPIIFVTAGTERESHLSRGYSLGAVDYLFTPVVPEILRAKVAAFIDLARRTETIRRREEQLRLAAEQRASLLESRLQALLNRLEVGIFLSTREGRLIEANPAFLRLVGAEAVADAGANVLAGDGTPDRGGGLFAAEHLNAATDVEILLSDERRVWVSVSKALSRLPTGEECVEGLVVDITDRKRAADELQRANEALRRSNEELSRFAHAVSHDLQAPLRMISLYGEILQVDHAGTLDPEAERLVTSMVQGSHRMHAMLRDLLAYSQVDLADLPLTEVDCEAALRGALENLEQPIAETGARITHGPLPMVRARPVHVLQVFQNLLSNALKYRSDRPPEVHVSADRRDSEWLFSVRDNGIGFDPGHSARAFQLFGRLHGDAYPGTGVGLAVCAKAIERHGGRMWADSTPGQGSTFHFTLPA